MAFFNELVRTIAAVEGMDEMTVRGIGINVRDQGLITKGGRGLSAAKMTIKDAVNLLIGVNGASLSKFSGEMVPIYRNLQVRSVWNEVGKLSGSLKKVFEPGVQFGDAFENLFEVITFAHGSGDNLREVMIDSIDFGEDLNQKITSSKNIDDCVTLEINFSRPDATINIIFKDAHNDKTHCQIDFYSLDIIPECDRYDITAISQKTLRAVALIL